MKMCHTLGVVPLLLVVTAAWPQVPPDQSSTAEAAAPATATGPPPAGPASVALVLAAGTLVPLRLLEAVGSDTSQPGSSFRLEVTDDLYVGHQQVIPAGTIATGEIVHAAKAGRLGKAGELLISARYLTVGTHQIRLRSNLGNKGQSRDMVALYLNPFIRGREIIMPIGTELVARTAIDESFAASDPVTTAH